jgi:hypothetical protein
MIKEVPGLCALLFTCLFKNPEGGMEYSVVEYMSKRGPLSKNHKPEEFQEVAYIASLISNKLPSSSRMNVSRASPLGT